MNTQQETINQIYVENKEIEATNSVLSKRNKELKNELEKQSKLIVKLNEVVAQNKADYQQQTLLVKKTTQANIKLMQEKSQLTKQIEIHKQNIAQIRAN